MVKDKRSGTLKIYKFFVVSLILLLLLQSQPVWAFEEYTKDVELLFDGAQGLEVFVFASPDGKGRAMPVEESQLMLHNVRAGDVFSYTISAPGCYTVITSFVITESDFDKQTKRISAVRQTKSGYGYEASRVQCWNKEVEEKLFGIKNLKNVDIGLLDTPAFQSSKAANAFTTVDEGIAYLKKIDDSASEGYLYFLDDQGRWPVIIFTRTDLSAADTLDSALGELSADGKLKVMYQAQIHGNEPAGGEGALTVASTLSKGGGEYLENMDVVIVPYVNRYGAKYFVRAGNSSGINLNRDSLSLRSNTTRRLHWLYGKLMPEVFIDGHEFAGTSAAIGQGGNGFFFRWLDDIQITCVNNLNRAGGIYSDEAAMVENTLGELRSKGFRTFMYNPSCNNTTACNYARLRNSYSFLIESNGIGLGKNHFRRRVLSQHEAVLSILQQTHQKSQNIRENVRAARETLAGKGKAYSASNRFVLKHRYSDEEGFYIPRPSFDFLGNFVGSPDKTERCTNAAGALRSRSKPTAYIIPKNTAGARTVRNILAANGVRYFEVGKGTRIPVRQYFGTEYKAAAGSRKKVVFSAGAYVFFMDQETANIISASLEPDVSDTAGYRGSFVQARVLESSSGGRLPIYRYEFSNPQTTLRLLIKEQPVNAEVKGFAPIRFSAKALGRHVSYRWYYRKPKSKTWKKCAESSSSKATLTVRKPEERRGYRYRCVVSNGVIQVISREARVVKKR